MPKETVLDAACPVCGCGSVKLRATFSTSGVSVLQCGQCSHTFARPLPSSDSPSANAMATESSLEFTLGLIGQSQDVKDRQALLAQNRSDYYLGQLGGGRKSFRILEVGCGSGGLGAGFSSLGVDYLGIDIDHRVVEEGQRNGVNTQLIDLMDLSLDEKFDVIFFTQVLEHIVLPHDFLAKVRRHLSTPGLIHLDVPSHGTLAGWPSIAAGGFRHRQRFGAIDYPHHCMAYSKQSLSRALAQVPSLSSEIFTKACDDRIWGQAIGTPSLRVKAFYRASEVLRSESLLVAIGKTTGEAAEFAS